MIPVASDQRTDDSRNSTLICAPLLLSIKHEPTLMLFIAIFSPKTYNMYSQYLNFGETDNVHLDLVCIGITFFFFYKSVKRMSLAQQRWLWHRDLVNRVYFQAYSLYLRTIRH